MKLIVNADDFGLVSGVNRSIIDCFLAGSVSSTTLMVNCEASEEAAAFARQYPDLGTGLHFNLTLGRPLSDPVSVPSLVQQDGSFFARQECEKKLLLGHLKRKEIRREFQAQIERFNSFKIPMTHIDSHQHVHLFPRVFDVVAKYCQHENIPLRVPIVWHGPAIKSTLKRYVRSTLLSVLIKYNMARWQKRIRCNAGFASIFDIAVSPNMITLEHYKQILQNIEKEKTPFELMVHPARVDDKLQGLTRITDVSKVEGQLLSTNNLGKIASKYAIQLVTYQEV